MERKSPSQSKAGSEDRGGTIVMMITRSVLVFAVSVIFLSCNTYNHLQDVEDSSYKFDKDLKTGYDAQIDSILLPYRDGMEKEMGQIVGYIDHDMSIGQPESTLGNFVADAIYLQTLQVHSQPLDFAVQNHGGIRVTTVGAGPLTRGRVFEIMPFDNTLVVIHADSSLVRKFCDHMAEGDGWPISEGLRFTMDGDKASDILVNGQPLSSKEDYWFATNDYLVNGGDNCDFLEEDAEEVFRYPDLIRDLILEYVKENYSIDNPAEAKIEQRIQIKNNE